MERDSHSSLYLPADARVDRRKVLAGAIGSTGSIFLSRFREAQATTSPNNLPEIPPLGEDLYQTDWLGVQFNVKMPEIWTPHTEEDFGIKKIVFEGENHPRVEFYFEASEEDTAAGIGQARKEALKLKQTEMIGVQLKEVFYSPSGDKKAVVSALIPGEMGQIEAFYGNYYDVALNNTSRVLCAEMRTIGIAEIAPYDMRAFYDGLEHLNIQPLS